MTKEEKKVDGGAGTAVQESGEQRETWGNQLQFFFYTLGYAVGFGNVWRFPYLCYKNGGAAFLIPYVTILFCAGIALFFLELIMGQYISLGPATLFPRLAPIFSGLGWGMVMISLLTAIYFNIILAWTFFYIFSSFTSELPWATCQHDFNSPECYTKEDAMVCQNETTDEYYYNNTCLDIASYCGIKDYVPFNETHCVNPNNTADVVPAQSLVHRVTPSEDFYKYRMLGVEGRTWDDMGGLRWELVGCLALGWVIVAACLAKGVKTTGKIVYFTALFPYFVLVILFARGITLEGSDLGIEYYILKPNMTRVGEMQVWSDAAIQIFYSLGVCFGCHVTLSSYNKFTNNCMRDAIVISICNCTTSVFIGLVIFSVLGFLATELGVGIDEVATSGSGLAFVVYPAAVALMPLPQLWSILFFLMLMTLGFGSQFTMVETVTTAIKDQFPQLREKKELVVIVTCIAIFLMGLTMCLEGGVYMFELFFYYSAGVSVMILGLTELLGAHIVFGYHNVMGAVKEMGIKMPLVLRGYWTLTWLLLTPVTLVMISFFTIYYHEPAYWGDYVFPTEIQVLGWLMCLFSAAFIPAGAALAWYRNTSGSYKTLIRPDPEFCPATKRAAMREGRAEAATAAGQDNPAFQTFNITITDADAEPKKD